MIFLIVWFFKIFEEFMVGKIFIRILVGIGVIWNILWFRGYRNVILFV